jgi:hypothetical protein
MLEIHIRIRLKLYHFGQIRILQGAMVVCGAIFHACIQIRIRVVANPRELRSLILHQWMHCTADFETEKRVRKP